MTCSWNGPGGWGYANQLAKRFARSRIREKLEFLMDCYEEFKPTKEIRKAIADLFALRDAFVHATPVLKDIPIYDESGQELEFTAGNPPPATSLEFLPGEKAIESVAGLIDSARELIGTVSELEFSSAAYLDNH